MVFFVIQAHRRCHTRKVVKAATARDVEVAYPQHGWVDFRIARPEFKAICAAVQVFHFLSQRMSRLLVNW